MRLFAAVLPPVSAQRHLAQALALLDQADPVALESAPTQMGLDEPPRSGQAQHRRDYNHGQPNRRRPRRRQTQGKPWLPPSNWHVTLAFYGEVPSGYLPELAAQAEQMAQAHHPFRLELAGAGCFAGRTAWIGVGGQTDRLVALMDDCAGLWGADDPTTTRRNGRRPHLTITRQVTAAQLFDPVAALAVYRGPAWTVSQFNLLRSDLGQGPGGHALYTPVAEMALAIN